MTDKLHAWLTPGTITSLVSTILIVGSFVGVTNYRAERQDRDWESFQSSIQSQISEWKRTTDARIDKIDQRLDKMSNENLDNVRLQARFEALEKDLNRMTMDIRELNGKTQAQWDSLSSRIARSEARQQPN